MLENFLADLNDRQHEAVTTLDGPVLVIAGAGSGKTKTLTYRIAYLIKEKQVRPECIFAVTFTNKAANEMKERVAKLIGEQYIPYIGTFHSLCVKLLRRDGTAVGISPNFNIYDTNDAVDATKSAMQRLNINIKDFSPYKVHGLISSSKNELMTPTSYASFAKTPIQDAAARVYPLYQNMLKESNSLDFDDLIMKTVQLFAFKEILEKYQTQFTNILVDEYQDTNRAQYILVKLLANKHHNIYAVGDPDQSIYAFRGATLENILNFERDYPECKVILLEQNYRSSRTILKSAHHVISKNTKRKEKEMWTENLEGDKLKRYIASGEKDEAYFISRRVRDRGDFANIAVLYRTNAQSRAVEEVFLEDSVPYRLVGGLRFYDRKEIKDLLSYMRLIYNLKDSVAVNRIINVPPRKIGKKTIETIEEKANNAHIGIMEYLLNNKDTLPSSLLGFTVMIENFLAVLEKGEINLSSFLKLIADKSGYIKYMEDDDDESAKSRIENIKELDSVASRYDPQPLPDALRDFLENVSLIEQESVRAEDTNNAVTLMSVHSAKGLEFDTVFIIGLEEGLFPHGNSMYDPEDMEEERRLCYVAITRAKQKLYLLSAQTRMLYGSVQSNPVSRFLKDIPDNLIVQETAYAGYTQGYKSSQYSAHSAPMVNNFEKGDYVAHPTFGSGWVINSEGESITVDFDTHGVKKLLLSFAKGIRKIAY